MGTLLQDLRYGVRVLIKNRSLSLVAVSTLALGIGANSAIFTVVNAVLLRPLPYAEPDQLVLVHQTEKSSGTGSIASYPNFEDWRAQSQSFEDLAAFAGWPFALTGIDAAEQLEGAVITDGFLSLLRVRPILGTDFLQSDNLMNSERVVLLSHSLWQRAFGGDPSLIGRSITLNEKPFTVRGILPADFSFPFGLEKAEVWTTATIYEGVRTARNARSVRVVGRLKPGVTGDQARAEMTTIAGRLEEQYPKFNATAGAAVVGLHNELVKDVGSALWMLLGVVGFVLLIACSNVANLLLARASARRKELAIRAALGASRSQIIRQLLTESLLLSVLGGIAGLFVAAWGLGLLLAVVPKDLPRLSSVRLDGTVLGFTMVASILTGMIFGLAPALKASRLDLNEVLKASSTGVMGGRGRQRMRGVLVVAEVAMAFVLLIGAGLLLKSFVKLRSTGLGFDPEHVLAVSLRLPISKYRTGQERVALFQEALRGVESLPSVTAASLTTDVPFVTRWQDPNFTIVGRPVRREMSAYLSAISPGYFRTMEIPLKKGRDFTEADNKTANGVVIINEAFAQRFFPDQDPLGQRITNSTFAEGDRDEPSTFEIVAVAGDVRQVSLIKESVPEMWMPHAQKSYRRASLVIRTNSDPEALIAAVRGQIAAIDRDQPLYDIRPLSQVIANSVAQPRFYTVLLGTFASIGLLLALGGIYGVISYSVTESTREIGIRMALGAQQRDVVRQVVGSGMGLVTIGAAIGLVGALALTRVISGLLFGVAATDATTFVVISGLLAGVGLVACYLPARRATKVDPMVALRYE